MSVMSSILHRVYDEDNAGGCATQAALGAAVPQASPQGIDVGEILARIAAKKREKLHWRSSIVDLLKLLNLDSSFGARCELARELGYSGGQEDSAAMNMWLHKEVMRKLGESNPKVLNSFLN